MKGAIAWMAKNPVASNLFMFVIFVAGALGLMRIKMEVFPEFSLDTVVVSVAYPGASPDEVEQGIVLAVEEAVRGVTGVKRVNSASAESVGTVSAELLLSADPDKVLSDIDAEIGRIQTFPEDAEEPSVVLLDNRSKVITLVIAGDHDLHTLHGLAEQARTGLLASDDVTYAEVGGLPELEVAIDVPRESLESLGLTLDEIAAQLRFGSSELPGGAVKTEGGEILVKLDERRRTAEGFADIVLRGTRDGDALRLGDIATVSESFADTDQATYYNGQPAVFVKVYRVGEESPQQVSDATKVYTEQLRAELPDTVLVEYWDDDAEILRQRIDLLVRNARLGIVLVLIILALFLDMRLAFWVGLGIPISFMGAFALMPGTGQTLNMISLFGLIITLGMVVDDAIVVGENAFEKMERGLPPMKASIEGASEMLVPVTFAILTTIAAFAPLFFVPGVFGKIFALFPAVVVSVLIFSLIESFLILPAHLSHSKRTTTTSGIMAIIDKPRAFVAGGLATFIEKVYKPSVATAVEWRYVSAAFALAILLSSCGLVAGGIVPVGFFPKIEGDVVTAAARLPYGAPPQQTAQLRESMEQAARAARTEIGPEYFQGMLTKVGEGPQQGFGPGEVGGHLLTIELELSPGDQRDVSAETIANTWAANFQPFPGLETISFSSQTGPGAGAALTVQLASTDGEALAAASDAVSEALRGYPDLTDIFNEYAAGKTQLEFELLPNAPTLGLTANEVGRQIRAAFQGVEAVRDQRGRNELTVRVRLPKEQRSSEFDLEQLSIRTPTGAWVPLSSVAEFTRGRSPTTIQREDGARIVNITAELAPGVRSNSDIVAVINSDVIPKIEADFPTVKAGMAGSQREQMESLSALGTNYIAALFAIFVLLAIPFRSYVQPFIIMSAIPFGVVGAILGHLLLGYEVSLISMFGIIALSGVVVNDSLVLVDTANRARGEGMSALDAILYAGQRRLRPILLTSLTTFFGLMPMILETSMQARFLIPMAISLGCGLIFATFIILLLVPCSYMIIEDLRELYGFRDEHATPVPADVDAAK